MAELWFSGKDVKYIAEFLKVDPRLVYRDMEYIEEHANDLMKNYLVKTVPHIINKSIYQIDLANRESIKIMQDQNTDPKLKVTAALAVAKTARDVVEIIAGNKSIVDRALEFEGFAKAKEEEMLDEFLSRNSTQTEEQAEDPERVF